MALKTIRFTKEEMNSRVARFDQLQGFDGGCPIVNTQTVFAHYLM